MASGSFRQTVININLVGALHTLRLASETGIRVGSKIKQPEWKPSCRERERDALCALFFFSFFERPSAAAFLRLARRSLLGIIYHAAWTSNFAFA
jgi:hypothetical protein